MSAQTLFFLESLMFLSVIFLHLLKKNRSAIFAYVAQSLVIASMLLVAAFASGSWWAITVALATLVVKVILAPYFFSRLVRRHRLVFSVSTYLNSPMTLIVLAALTALPFSHVFQPLTVLAPQHADALLLALAMMFISIFLIVNRKGALSQIIGILSLENAVVSFAFVAGLEASAGPQIGILFDIVVWITIATVFASMIYRHFGTLDVSAMRALKEE